MSLSDKIIKLTDEKPDNWISCLLRDDVKESIKELKESITLIEGHTAYESKVLERINEIFMVCVTVHHLEVHSWIQHVDHFVSSSRYHMAWDIRLCSPGP